jgi:hypothetical protein
MTSERVIDMTSETMIDFVGIPNHQFNQNLPELGIIEGNQQVAMKRDESTSPSLFTFRSRLVTLTPCLQSRAGKTLNALSGVAYRKKLSGRAWPGNEDPIGFDGGGNSYAYGQNDPIDENDPDGRDWKPS